MIYHQSKFVVLRSHAAIVQKQTIGVSGVTIGPCARAYLDGVRCQGLLFASV